MVTRTRAWVKYLIVRGFVLERSVWSWVLVLGCLSRGVSYTVRPPETNTPAAQRIEGALSYDAWALAMFGIALLLTVGLLLKRHNLTWLGHLFGLGASATLALSVLSAAVFDGAGWSAFWPLVVVTLVHYGRINALGPRVEAPPSIKKRLEKRASD